MVFLSTVVVGSCPPSRLNFDFILRRQHCSSNSSPPEQERHHNQLINTRECPTFVIGFSHGCKLRSTSLSNTSFRNLDKIASYSSSHFNIKINTIRSLTRGASYLSFRAFRFDCTSPHIIKLSLDDASQPVEVLVELLPIALWFPLLKS